MQSSLLSTPKTMISPISWPSSLRSPGKRKLPGVRRIVWLAITVGAFAGQAWAHERHVESATGSLLDKAMAAQAHHDFSGALSFVNAALAAAPYDDRAWLLRASLHLIRGEIDEAAASCRGLRRSSPLIVVTCHANVARSTGEVESIRHKLDRLIEINDSRRIEPQTFAWSLGVAGDLAVAAGEPDRAAQYFRRSLDFVDNPQVRASLVEIFIAQDRLSDAQRLLDEGESSLTLVVQELIIRKSLNDDIEADIARLDRRFRYWIGHDDYEHAREMARFYLDVVGDVVQAHALAQINANLQHEPEDHWLAYRAAAAVRNQTDTTPR